MVDHNKLSLMNVSSHITIFRWKPAAWLRVTGPDSGDFLQGQFTNDLASIAYDKAVYGLWLNLKGKVVADSFVFRGPEPDEYWVGSYYSSAAVIRERLESHIIADDVSVEDQTDRWDAVTVFGAGGDAAGNGQRQAGQPGFAFRGRRVREDHTEWVFPVSAADTIDWRRSDLATIDAAEMERRRIVAGIPAIPRDIGPGDLPNEAGLETDAISYTKGCYLGQEVMARLKSMGQVRRRLLRLTGPAPMPGTLPCPVFAGGRQVGELRSVATATDGGIVGLAMLSLLHVSSKPPLSLAAEAEPVLRLLDAP
jgi:folate-binding protein YgfZ